MNFWLSFLAYGIFQGMFLVCFLLFAKKMEQAKKWLLISLISVLLLLTADYVLSIYYMTTASKAFWGISLTTPLWFMVSPLFYLVFTAHTSDKFSFNKIDSLHFLPFLLSFASSIPFFLLSPDIRQSYMLAYSNGQEITWLHLLSKAIYHTQLVIYPLLVFRLMAQRKVSFQSFIALVNIGLLFIGLSSFVHLLSFNFFQLSISWFTSVLVFVSLTVFVHGLVLVLMAYPHHLTTSFKKVVFKKYKNSNLVRLDIIALEERLTKLMEIHRVFTQPQLRQADLARLLSVNPNQLSQYLNQEKQQSFNDYLNAYRIAAAQVLLLSPKKEQFTIEAIATEVGFKSSATFYRSFKKQTGLTPSHWLSTQI